MPDVSEVVGKASRLTETESLEIYSLHVRVRAFAAFGDEAIDPLGDNGQRYRAQLEHRIVEGADVEFPAQRADLTPKAGSRNKTQADRPFTPKNRNPANDLECLKHSS